MDHSIVARLAALALAASFFCAPAAAAAPDCDARLAGLQRDLLERFPGRVDDVDAAIADAGNPLHGYSLSHGDVVLAGLGLTLVQFDDPERPQLLFYWPTAAPPAEWLDFDGPDGPYELVGWGYVPARYPDSADPPQRDCIPAEAWFIHDAGWHLLDGGMRVTAGHRDAEPPRPADLDGRIMYWHPAAWDIHLWVRDGVPAISLFDDQRPEGGLELPGDAFWYPSRRADPADG